MGLFNQDLGKYVYIVPQKTYLSGEEASEAPQAVKSKDDIVILTATENFSKTESGSATNFRVGDGTDRSDNYKVNGARITFTGVIGPRLVNMLSAFLGGTPPDSPQDYVRRVKAFFHNKQQRDSLVTIYLPDGTGETNCVLTSFRLSRTAELSDGFKVTISAQKLPLTTEALAVVAATDLYSNSTESGKTPTTGVGGEGVSKDELIIGNAELSIRDGL
tara:strand:- start:3070 stop:3723 length:654 start_codon:yes stop_codon:yes gene_type:complete